MEGAGCFIIAIIGVIFVAIINKLRGNNASSSGGGSHGGDWG